MDRKSYVIKYGESSVRKGAFFMGKRGDQDADILWYRNQPQPDKNG